MKGVIFSACLLGLLVAPHLFPLQRVSPLTGAAAWLSTLAIRATVSVGAAVFAFVYVPQTALTRAVADWCWHEVLPTLTDLLGFSGHPVSHAAVALPALMLVASLLWLGFGLLRGWMGVRRTLRRSIGTGPLGSTVVEDDRDIVLAVTRLGRGRVLVSRRALRSMDEAELQAGLAHELGHIHRRHRSLLLAAAVLAALARPLPGTRAVERGLRFSLERDADEYAVRKTRDRLALASVICKAAVARPSSAVVALGDPGSVTGRLRVLVDPVEAPSRRLRLSATAFVGVLAVAAAALMLAVPALAVSAPGGVQAAGSSHVCHHHH
jgi:Zn-dependent protease with chaperone function